MRKIRRLFALFLREEGPFGPAFYESGGVLKISPRVKLGGRSETAALPRRDSTPEALRRPAPDPGAEA